MLNYISIHTLDVIANYVGWVQIFVLIGGTYGVFFGGNSSRAGAGRGHSAMGLGRFSQSNTLNQNSSKIVREKK